MRCFVALCVALLLAQCLAISVFSPSKRQPLGWARRGEPAPSDSIRLSLALKQNNLDVVESTLLRISDPREETYGQWLSLDDIEELIAPSDAEFDAVVSWLEANGITDATTRQTRDWINVETTVEKVEALLSCNIVFFHQKFEDQWIMRAEGQYSFPDEIAEIVDFVAGLHGFPFAAWKPISTRVASHERGATFNTPETVYDLYNIDVPTGPCDCDSTQAVVEFSSANYSPADLQTFFQTYAPQFDGQRVENIYGSNNANGFISTEANLDVQYIMAIGGFIETSDYVQERNPSILDSFLDYTYQVGNQTNPAYVQSISWGDYGGDYNNQTVQRISNEFMLMGSRGITVSLASGDNGVGCGELCTAQEFDFPSSPYVTMVGSSGLNRNGEEVAASFSSGGFSRDYWTPTWQTEAVATYFKTASSLPSTSYDSNGRGYPDVSALGVDLEVVVRGKSEPVGGTSASAPIFGGIIALLNAQRALAGKGPLGFINPWIYQNPNMFNDVTSGSNNYKCCEGFSAAAGWDPITGMGTPKYPQMLSSAMALP